MRGSRFRIACLCAGFVAVAALTAGAATANETAASPRVVFVLDRGGGCPRRGTLELCEGIREAMRLTGVTGRIVALADAKGCDLPKLTLEDLKSVDKRLTEGAFSVLDVSKSVKSRSSYGGTAPGNVRREAKKWIKRLKKAAGSR